MEEKNLFTHVGPLDKKDHTEYAYVSFWGDVGRRFFSSKTTIFCLALLVIIFLGCMIIPALNPDAITGVNLLAINKKPGGEYLMGTDRYGHDVFIKGWAGGRVSFLVGFVAAICQAIIGVIIGSIAGYAGGKVDMIIMRIVDIMIAIPYMIVVLVIQVVAGRGISTIILALVITGWLNTARLTRGQILQLKNEDYVMAAQSLNVRGSTIILRHLLPNILSVILVSVTMAIPSAMFSEAFLSFIGMGTSDVSWGSLIRTGMDVRALAPWQLIWPGILLAATMLCIQLLGDSLRDALDPKLRR